MGRRPASTRRRAAWLAVAPAVVVLLAGLIATVVATSVLVDREHTLARLELERRTASLKARIEHAFVVPLQAVYAISSYLRATELRVDRAGFARFTAPTIQREPAIYALEWAPVVAHADRAAIEARAAAEGLAGWRITDTDGGGGFVTAADRAWYVPLLYAEPPNAALGFDLASLPDRKEHILRSRDGGYAIVSDRLQLVEDPPGLWAVAVYEPVWRDGAPPVDVAARAGALVGFAICVFRVRPVIERALGAAARDGVDVALTDPAGPPGDRTLWESRPGAAERVLSAERRHTAALTFVDRTWRVTVAARGDDAATLPRSRLVLFGGAVMSALAAALIAGVRLARRQRRAADDRQLGPYTLLRPIGGGGMGVVYAARHALLRRPTAIKLLPPDASDGEALERFEREVRLTAELTHPNVVAIYDYGRTPDGTFYYAMELLDGITFDELLSVSGPQPVARTVHLIRQLTSAIGEAHARGLVHRDLKPANLMLVERGGDPDFVKVLDFGLVKRLVPSTTEEDGDGGATAAASSPDAGLTRPGIMFGTPGFSPPEAMRGEPTEAAGDVYSIGAVWYALLAGRPPFKGPSPRAVGLVQVSSTPPAPSRWRGERVEHPEQVPPELDALILRCMDRKPGNRPPSAAALLAELDKLDVPRWTRDDARLWWATHGARVRAVVSRRRAEQALDGRHHETLPIDAARRRGG